MAEDSRTLRELLRTARSRIAPSEAGLPNRGCRRARGLRREDVAELLGISEIWYARLETGRARGSLGLLARLAEVLRLDADARAVLFTFGRPELAALAPRSDDDVLPIGIGQATREARLLIEALQTASDRSEVVTQAVRAVSAIARPTALAFWIDQIDDGGNARFVETDGPAGSVMRGLWQSAAAAVHEAEIVRAAGTVTCEDLRASVSEEFRERIGRFGTRSYCSFGVTPAGAPWWAAIGFAGTAPQRFDAHVNEVLRLCAQATRWALTEAAGRAHVWR